MKKRFVLMHVGFEPPAPVDMAKWRIWFAEIATATEQNIGFSDGREVTRDGVTELARGRDCITGLTIIEAESLEAAQAMAARCPFVTAIRVCAMRGS